MQRISTDSKAVDLFGAGKHGYTAGDPPSGVPATEMSAAALNAIQEEIAGVIEGADINLDDAYDGQQLKRAVATIARDWLPEYTGTFGVDRLWRIRENGDERDTWYTRESMDLHLNAASGANMSTLFDTPLNTHFVGTATAVLVRTDDNTAEAGYVMTFHGSNVSGTASVNHEELTYSNDGGLAVSSVYMDFSTSYIKLRILLNALPAAKKYNLNVTLRYTTVTRFAP